MLSPDWAVESLDSFCWPLHAWHFFATFQTTLVQLRL